MNRKQRKVSKMTIEFSQYVTLFAGIVALCSSTACKSRFFSFGNEPLVNTNQPTGQDETRPGQIAIGQQNSSNTNTQPQSSSNQIAAPYTPLQGTQKKLTIGSTQRFEVSGQQVDVTFEQIIEDSRCPKDVVCIWEGQAKLQFAINVPALNLTKKVVPTLRVGHPELGQVTVGSVGLDLIGLSPDSSAANQKAVSPEATVVVGKAP